MHKRASAVIAVCLLLGASGFAKDKAKRTLPAYVLAAHTLTVIIDPGAGMSIDDPQANQVARSDVESAFLDWGRFEPVVSRQAADLIIVVRKGSGRMVNQTLANPRQNNRIGTIDASDSGASVGGQNGSQSPGLSGDAGPAGQQGPHPQTEIGEADDSFAVYEGHVENPLDSSPAWRYVARDGLRSHTVPAVAEFRKAVAEAEKAAAKTP